MRLFKIRWLFHYKLDLHQRFEARDCIGEQDRCVFELLRRFIQFDLDEEKIGRCQGLPLIFEGLELLFGRGELLCPVVQIGQKFAERPLELRGVDWSWRLCSHFHIGRAQVICRIGEFVFQEILLRRFQLEVGRVELRRRCRPS